MTSLGTHLRRIRSQFAQLPDKRRGSNTQYAMEDIAMAALSVFFMQSPSFLAHQRTLAEQQGRSNAQTLFGLDRIPCDNHLREMLDGMPPEYFNPQFHDLVDDLQQGGGLAPMRRLDGRLLIALDGTQTFHSRKLHCPNCSTRVKNGNTEYFHQMLAATVVAPGQAQTGPLPPEFIAPQDGHLKQDCEREAAKRWLERHGPRCAGLNPVYLGDALFACQSICQTLLDHGGDFLLTCKPGSHKTLYEYTEGVTLPTRRVSRGKGIQRRIFHYRWITDIPIRDGQDALRVNWLEVIIQRPNGTVTFRSAYLTNLDVNRDNVAELAECARARWKIENETFNVLKRQGYHLEHNFGHGKDTLASVLVLLNLLAFALHTVFDLTQLQWQQARQRLGARKRLFEHLRSITCYQVFPSWNHLLSGLATGQPSIRSP
ncbi:MAG: transposase [Gammaproteobacteria bacterium]|nr:transposase [Gammaproteobacteria bacterium]